MPRPTLKHFVHECLTIFEKQDVYGAKRCSAFSLVHERGGQQVELKTIRIGARQWDPKELAEIFESCAETFAGGVPGVQQFQLLAFFDDDERPRSFYPFRKSGEQDHAGIMTEAPTKEGQLQQQMRLLESCFRISMGGVVSIMERQDRFLERAYGRIEKMEEEQHELIELSKTIIMEKAAAEHDRAVAIHQMEQKSEDRRMMMRLLPPVANRVLGKEIFPQAVADTALFEHLAESLEEDQIKKLASILKPEQWGLVADRLVQILEAKAKRDEAKAKVKGTAEKKPEAAE